MYLGVMVGVFLAALHTPAAMADLGLTCTAARPYPLSMIETALKKFYNQTQGPTSWPPLYRAGWDRPNYCAFDGNEGAHPPPAGVRCFLGGGGGWALDPPKGIGGLIFLFHISGEARGPLPEEFKAFTNPDIIQLSGNHITGPIWDTSEACALMRLDLSHNEMSGTIPPNFMQKNLAALNMLNLGYNQFDGTLPPIIGQLGVTASLILRQNKFSGSIPDLSHAATLRHLDLAMNQFSGAVGPWLKELKNLVWFHVDNNQLNGAFPELPPRLSRFSGSNNGFEGPIPASVGSLGYLRYFNCTNCNKLTCPRDDMLAHLDFTTHCGGSKAKFAKAAS